MKPVLLADDLTGALEAASAFAERGWIPVLSLEREAPVASSAPRMRVVSTETRNATPAKARSVLAHSLAQIALRKETLVFKKIDSTMRGPVGAELAALIELDSRPVVFTPANPAAGRTVERGFLFVHGVPVSETPFGKDPLMPVKDSLVARILAAGRAPLDKILVCDASTRSDLSQLVTDAHERLKDPCFVGSGALAQAVAASMPVPGAPAPEKPTPVKGPILIVSGSRHPASHAQIEGLARHLSLTVATLEASSSKADLVAALVASLQEKGAACLVAGKGDDDPLRVAPALAAVVGHVALQISLDCLVVSGGETCRQLCGALGGSEIEVRSAFEVGAVLARLTTPGGTKTLVTKPGGFGDDKTLIRIYETLRR